MTYEEWGNSGPKLAGWGVEIYADWTRDREVLLAEKAQKQMACDSYKENYRQAEARAEAAEAELREARARVKRLEGALERLLPPFYGVLCEKFGHPDQWKDDRDGIVVYRAARAVLEEGK